MLVEGVTLSQKLVFASPLLNTTIDGPAGKVVEFASRIIVKGLALEGNGRLPTNETRMNKGGNGRGPLARLIGALVGFIIS